MTADSKQFCFAQHRVICVITLALSGNGGRTSIVVKAGAPVSPALISPPRPLDFRLMRGWSPSGVTDPPKGFKSSCEYSGGNGSVLVIVAVAVGLLDQVNEIDMHN